MDDRNANVSELGRFLSLQPVFCAGNTSVWLALEIDLNINYKRHGTIFVQVTSHHPISVFEKSLLLLHIFCGPLISGWKMVTTGGNAYYPPFSPLLPQGDVERKWVHFQIVTVLVEVYVGPYLTLHCNTMGSKISLLWEWQRRYNHFLSGCFMGSQFSFLALEANLLQ